jgi:hypothetical protein
MQDNFSAIRVDTPENAPKNMDLEPLLDLTKYSIEKSHEFNQYIIGRPQEKAIPAHILQSLAKNWANCHNI